jgi:hypothetical protein
MSSVPHHLRTLHLAQAEKFHKFRIRTYSTVAMIGGFILIIWMGHVPLMALIFTIQARMLLTLYQALSILPPCITAGV